MAEPAGEVLLSRDGGVLTITLNSPEVRNALTPAIEAGLIAGIHEASSPDIRAVVLTARGPAFCAGANMKELDSNDGKDAASLRLRAREIPEKILLPLSRLEKPVVVAVNGPVVGAGIGLALAGDYRLCASSAAFVFAFMRLGLTPDLGISWALPRLIGYRASRDLLLRGRTVGSVDAVTMGLADEVVADEELGDAAAAMAKDFAAAPTMAWGATKQLLRKGAELSLERFLDEEVLVQTMLVRTQDHGEGISAFAAGRRPDFQGR